MKKIANRSDGSHQVELCRVEQSHSIALDPAFLLRDAVQDLNRIALVDNDNYNEMLLSPSSAKCSETDGLIEAQEKLAATEEAMLHDPEQVQTGHALGGLARAIYGFHSYIHALKDVSDKHASEHRRQASEILKLQRKVEELQSQNSKIRKYARQVVNDNITLTDKLNQASRDKKKLFRHAKNLTKEIHNAKKYNEELQVLAHDLILIMASCSRERKETSETEVSTVCNDDGRESTREVHGDFSSKCTFHPLPRVLVIPANETFPLDVQDESSMTALQAPSLCESLSNDMSQSPMFANLLEEAVGLQTNSQDGSLSEAGCEIQDGSGSGVSTAEHPLIENVSETASRHPKTLLQSLGFSRKVPAESGLSKHSSIFREKSNRTNKATSSRNDGGPGTGLECSPSSCSIEAPKKLARQDEQIKTAMHLNDSAGEADMLESTYGLGSERGGNKPKGIFPFWNRGQHNVA